MVFSDLCGGAIHEQFDAGDVESTLAAGDQ